MAFEYNGFIHRDLEPQVRYDAEQIQLLKQEDVAINERIDNIPLGAEKVALTFPAGASEGTITEEQLTKLQASESNYIEMVNDKELYYLNDHGHTDGYLTYSHVGIENSKATIKTLTITVSAKSFVIVTTVVPTESGGGKLYQHIINIGNGEDKILSFSTYSSKINLTYDDLKNINKLDAFYLTNYTTRYIVVSIDIIISPNSTKTTFAYATKYPIDESEYGFEELPSNIYSLSDKVTEL